MAGRFGSWFRRRVVRADLVPTDFISGMGGASRFATFLEDGRGGRVFWAVVTTVELVLFVGLAALMLTFPWQRPQADGSPEWGWLPFTGTIALGCGWMALLYQGALRGMARAWSAPRLVDEDPEDDEDDEDDRRGWDDAGR